MSEDTNKKSKDYMKEIENEKPKKLSITNNENIKKQKKKIVY